MPDREKVIKGLECCMSETTCYKCPYKSEDECENGGYYYSKAIEDAIAILREQEPVEPIETLDGNGNLWSDCGKCGGVLPKDAQYCPTCGRKVKWG